MTIFSNKKGLLILAWGEKEQDMAGEEGSCRDGAALFWDKHSSSPQRGNKKTLEMLEWGLEVGTDCRVISRPHKNFKALLGCNT